jgi:hypothetical protein
MRRLIAGLVMAGAVLLGTTSDAEAAKPKAKKGAAPLAGSQFQRLDTNKDGKLSRDEFRAVQGGKGKGGKNGGTDALFTKLDTNGDNFLSPAEFAKMGAAGAQGKKKNK